MIKQYLKRLYVRLRYGGDRFHCPICEEGFRAMRPLKAQWYVRNERLDHYTPHAICPSCDSWIRHRFLMKFLQEKHLLDRNPLRLLHFAPEDQLAVHIQKHYPHVQYHCADMDSERYRKWKAIKINLEAIDLPSEFCEGLICFHVLELIEHDQAAVAELFRILKPKGFAIIGVPIYGSKTESKEGLSAFERERWYGFSENYRLYGLDIEQLLAKAGFRVQRFCFADFTAEYYDPTHESAHINSDQYLFYCEK
jgi:SAM-dependent methyltransferase